jgi:glycosyltransferase involved in cell wall biosynthesis
MNMKEYIELTRHESHMPHNSLVSVIIIFLNAADFLQEAIESVLVQTYENWELLLIDDGSSDKSSEIARFFASQRPSQISCLDHHEHQNLGMSASRNLGILNAKGEYIAFLDADDYWLPNKLETDVKYLGSNPTIGMLFGSTKYWFSWAGRSEDKLRDYVPRNSVRSETFFNPPQLFLLFLEGKVEIPCPSSVMVRTEAITGIGGFEESFQGMYEDQAFYTKISLAMPVLATNDCLAWYRQHPKSVSSIAAKSDQYSSLHYSFLKWVKNYCELKNVTDARVMQVVRRQLWLYHNRPLRIFPFIHPKSLRWLKKWVLRVEERIIPPMIRSWLWSNLGE